MNTTQLQSEATELAKDFEKRVPLLALPSINQVKKAAELIAGLLAENEALRDTVQFVERWAVHHGTKDSLSAKEALSAIQHYPGITEVTEGYADGKRPDAFNPFAKIAELDALLKLADARINAQVAAQSAQAAPQAVKLPELSDLQAAIRKGGLVTNNDAWTIAEQVRDLLATHPTQQGLDAAKFNRLELEIRGITKMLPEKFDCSGVWAAFEAAQAKQGGA